MDIRGEYRFSSRVKQNKKAKICFVIHIAGEKKLSFYIYDVIVKQIFYIIGPLITTQRADHRQSERRKRRKVEGREEAREADVKTPRYQVSAR